MARTYDLDLTLVEFQRYIDMYVAIGNGSIDFGVVGPGDMVLGLSQGDNRVVAVSQEKRRRSIDGSSAIGWLF